MTQMISSREALRKACLDLLERCATVHPAGHQDKLAARYILHRGDGARIGLMFEKSVGTPRYLWVEQRLAGELLDRDIDFRLYLAAALYQVDSVSGRRSYGRHAALKAMRDLANVDLVRFTIDRIAQLELILRQLAAT